MTSTSLVMTADDLVGYELPGKRVELVRGRLLVHEPPGFEHGKVTVRIAVALSQFVAASTPPLGEVVAGDPGFWLQHDPDTVRAPDVAFVRGDRLPPGPIRGFADFAPHLAVEVRSPSDRTGEVLAKVADWLSAGTALVWVVDPMRRTAQVYRLDGSISLLGDADELQGEGVLPGFTLPLATLVSDPGLSESR